MCSSKFFNSYRNLNIISFFLCALMICYLCTMRVATAASTNVNIFRQYKKTLNILNILMRGSILYRIDWFNIKKMISVYLVQSLEEIHQPLHLLAVFLKRRTPYILNKRARAQTNAHARQWNQIMFCASVCVRVCVCPFAAGCAKKWSGCGFFFFFNINKVSRCR